MKPLRLRQARQGKETKGNDSKGEAAPDSTKVKKKEFERSTFLHHLPLDYHPMPIQAIAPSFFFLERIHFYPFYPLYSFPLRLVALLTALLVRCWQTHQFRHLRSVVEIELDN